MPRTRTGGIEEVDGRLYARVTVKLTDGRKVRRRVRLDPSLTKRAAKHEATKLAREAAGFLFDPRKQAAPRPLATVLSPTVDDFHADWATDRERRGRVSERGRYEKHIRPVLGARKMRDITKDHARKLSAELDEKVLSKELHWSTAVKVWGVATKMFRDAVESKIANLRVLDTTPFDGVKGPERGVRKGKQWLYPVELTALLACADVPLRWRELYALMAYFYTRPEELAALECEDVNLQHGYVHVHRAIDLRTGESKPTKTKRTRKVPIKPALRPLIERLIREAGETGPLVRFEHANKKQTHGLPPVEDLAATLRAHLLRAGVDRADLHRQAPGTKRITFYDLRATGITWEALAKTEMLTIMQRAGHEEPKTTLGYIREAEAVGYDAGEPFPPLPASLEKATRNGLTACVSSQAAENADKKQRPQRDSNSRQRSGHATNRTNAAAPEAGGNSGVPPVDGEAKTARPNPEAPVGDDQRAAVVDLEAAREHRRLLWRGKRRSQRPAASGNDGAPETASQSDQPAASGNDRLNVSIGQPDRESRLPELSARRLASAAIVDLGAARERRRR